MRPLPSLLLIATISAKPPVPRYPLHAVPLSRRKTVIATQLEILNFIKHFGPNHTATLTLSFPRDTNLKKAQSIFNNANRRFLKELFPAWIAVVEFDSYDCPHFHLVVATRQDFRSSFNFDAYHSMRDLTKRAYAEHRSLTTAEKIERGQHARNLTTDPALKALWKQLRKQLPRHGFSKSRPAELIPIEKNGVAVAVYLTKQFLTEPLRSRIPKRAKVFRTSDTCPRVIPRLADLVIDTPGRARYLERRERILSLLRCSDLPGMPLEGTRCWHWRSNQAQQALFDRYGFHAIPWELPEVFRMLEEVMLYGYVQPPTDLWELLKPL